MAMLLPVGDAHEGPGRRHDVKVNICFHELGIRNAAQLSLRGRFGNGRDGCEDEDVDPGEENVLLSGWDGCAKL